MHHWTYLNGDYSPEESAKLHISDLSFQRGYGIFDFFRLAGSQPVFLEDHLDRFYRSAMQMHLKLPLEREQLKTAISGLILRNSLPLSGIRLGLTGGYSDDGFHTAVPNLVITQRPFSETTTKQREEGLRLLSFAHQRQLPGVKSTDYLMAVWLQPLLLEKKADDVLYHHDGWISECPRSNFFIVTADNILVTPKENVLEGITRKKVLKLAAGYCAVEQRPVHLSELTQAKEAFITSTTKQILPVRQIDGTIFTSNVISSALQEMLCGLYPR